MTHRLQFDQIGHSCEGAALDKWDSVVLKVSGKKPVIQAPCMKIRWDEQSSQAAEPGECPVRKRCDLVWIQVSVQKGTMKDFFVSYFIVAYKSIKYPSPENAPLAIEVMLLFRRNLKFNTWVKLSCNMDNHSSQCCQVSELGESSARKLGNVVCLQVTWTEYHDQFDIS